jgi:hypothetical protein
MSAVNGFPLMLNQEVPLGYGYPAEAFRAEHYAATSGGNGVGSPTALKVSAQPAPDGTIRTNPGGATLKSTYAGQDEQSYHTYFGPRTVEVSPTGSSAGGRTDLVVVQLCDPEHDNHWSYDGEYPIPADVAKDMEFQRIHVLEGRDRTASLDFPHALLAEISRPSNTTIVTDSHITDLRKLANPKSDRFYAARNLNIGEEQGANTNHTVWPVAATQTVSIPDFATRVVIGAHWGTVKTGPTTSTPAWGNVQVALVHPDGSEILTQASRWDAGAREGERFNIALGHWLNVPAKFRGVDARVEMRGTRFGGNSSPQMDSMSSYILDLQFEQRVA